ncbi:hypothetical protein AB0939_17725 [Streptomyces sp. NPDC006990]|uniref:hypothetical protein n=1 Tax=Streptomyces sp. NPDC006990 TaxID=3154481 RepID=UPI0034520C2F
MKLALSPVKKDGRTLSTGPAAEAMLHVHPPSILATAYGTGDADTGLRYTATVSPAGYPGRQYAATVLADGETCAGPTLVDSQRHGDTTVCEVDVPRLPPGVALDLVLSAADGVATGPPSRRFPLLAVPPSITSVVSTGPGKARATLCSPTGAALVTVAAAGEPATTALVRGSTGDIDVPPGAGPHSVTAMAVAGTATSVPSAPLQLITEPPVLTSARFDGTTVTASWISNGAAAEHRLRVHTEGVTVATAAAGHTSGTVGVCADGPLFLEVAGVCGQVVGPASQPLSLISRAPQVTGATTDPASGKTTLPWAAVEGATSYLLQSFRNGLACEEPRQVTGATCEVTAAPGSGSAVAVAAVVGTAATTVSGPYSSPYPLPTAQPTIAHVTFDGSAATVSWHPVQGATGYVVTALSATAAGSGRVPASATEVTFPLTGTAAGDDCAVVVQALSGPDSGPPSPPVPLVPESWFLSTAPATEAYPYLYPASGVAPAPGEVTVSLPVPGASFNGPVECGAFHLDASGRTLTIRAEPFSPQAVRDELRQNYSAFLSCVEKNGASPAGVALLQQAVSHAMPQTFAETLYYAYGLDREAGSVDLRPGTVLRVVFADYVNTGQPAPPPFVNGWSGSGQVDYEVTTWAAADGLRLGLDAFLAQFIASGSFSVDAPACRNGDVVSGLADTADLFGLATPTRYLRLFAPSTLSPADSVGTARTSGGFALAAAGSWTELEAAGRTPQPGRPVVAFRGRAVLRVCVRVMVDGAETVVPLGTTVGDVLAGRGRRPVPGAVRSPGIALERTPGPASVGTGHGASAGRRVRFDWCGVPEYSRGLGLDAFSLPLLAGDRLTTR